jgi:hypothetical protein
MKTQNPHIRRWTTARTTRLGLAIVAPMAATKAAPVSPAVTAARQINPTTVEIVLTEEKRLTLDFYGGGVQNGRYSHKGHQIAIENQNGWTDGGVASPNPFYWSTQGYGILWHTFKPGTYDFGAATKGEVRISHEADYLDIFVMVDALLQRDLVKEVREISPRPRRAGHLDQPLVSEDEVGWRTQDFRLFRPSTGGLSEVRDHRWQG